MRAMALFIGVLWLLATFPAVMMAALSGLAGDSGVAPAVYVFIFACFTLPVTTLAAAICSFVSGAKGEWRWAAFGSAAPSVAILVAMLAIPIGRAFQ